MITENKAGILDRFESFGSSLIVEVFHGSKPDRYLRVTNVDGSVITTLCKCSKRIFDWFNTEEIETHFINTSKHRLLSIKTKQHPPHMTPIQQAIEQVKKDIVNFNQQRNMCYPPRCGEWKSYDAKIEKSQIILNYLQSLLPVEKEWAKELWVTSNQEASSHPHACDFEQYYSQFNEVK